MKRILLFIKMQEFMKNNYKIVEFDEKPEVPKNNMASMGIYMFDWAQLREYLIKEQNYLDAVIGLPANIFYGTSIPTCILVFKKCSTLFSV